MEQTIYGICFSSAYGYELQEILQETKDSF